MGAFLNSWSTSFRVKGGVHASLTLAEIVEEAKKAIPDVVGMNTDQIIERLTIVECNSRANEMIIRYNSRPA